jgi:glycine/D-amino acid oxidase-like deaminating enzyme
MQDISLWQATAAPSPAWPALAGAQRAEAVVVGAGYTGLSAALHLAEAGRDVVVIDFHAPGWGASGRNGGQVIAGLKHDPDTLEAMFGEAGAAMASWAGSSPDLVFDLIRRHGIDCDAVRTGWLQLAVSEATMRVATSRASQWQARGAPASVLDSKEAARLSGSALYVGGWLDRRGGTLHPLAYARGLANAASAQGARIFAASPAVRLRRAGHGWQVDTPRGSVTAPTVILATNAYTGTLHDALRRSLVAVPSCQIASEPLPEPLRRMILPERQSASDMRRLLRYFRLDAQGRLLMGTRGAFGDVPPHAAIRHHLAALRDIFPEAAKLAFPYRWSGLVAMTRDHMPHLHEPAPGLLAGVGYNGRGVAMATSMGKLLAGRVAGACPGEPGLPVTSVSPLRFHRFSRLGARAAVQYLRLRDAVEGDIIK